VTFATVAATSPPPTWEGVRIVCISDTHDHCLDASRLPAGDILVHAGDWTGTGVGSKVKHFVEWMESLQSKYRHRVVIAGNHDVTLHKEYYERAWSRFHRRGKEDAELARSVVTGASFTFLEDTAAEIEGIKFYGSPWQPEFYDWAYNLPRGEPCAAKWREIPDDCDVLITHGPPIGVGDECDGSNRAGCVNLMHQIVSRVHPALHVFGHIHEGYGYFSCSSAPHTLFANASTCTYRYR